MRALGALAVVLLAGSAFGQSAPSSTLGAETDPAVLAVIDKLKSDPAFSDSVAARVIQSRLVGFLTPDADIGSRLAAAKDWISKDPDAAARVALGLASDDRRGRPIYEDGLLKQMATAYGANPGAQRNLFHTLHRSAKNSKLLERQSGGLSDDEKREILRTLFEGRGAQSGRVLNRKDDGKAAAQREAAFPGAAPGRPAAAAAPAVSFSGFYDRLSAGNIHGYSPRLMAMQSALNARRPPGAPILIETGKLDYATLSYPAYAMRFDVGNLEARLKAYRIVALAQAAGRSLAELDRRDPDLEQKLAAAAPAGAVSPRLTRAAEIVAKAGAALAAFQAAAEKTKDPRAISRETLIDLGRRQREAARWIADAALEEDLLLLEPDERFLTPDLLAAIDAVPAPLETRDAYKRRGAALQAATGKAKADAEKAKALLESSEWEKSLAQADALIAESRGLKRGLGRDIDDYARLPFRVAAARRVQPRWRARLDDLAVRWLPNLPYSRAVARRRDELSRLLSAFDLIAAGDAERAHARLGL